MREFRSFRWPAAVLAGLAFAPAALACTDIAPSYGVAVDGEAAAPVEHQAAARRAAFTPPEPAGPAAGIGELQLPDLDQEVPSELDVVEAPASHYRLGFRSGAVNVGHGPLVVEGRRSSTRTRTMTATQLVSRKGMTDVARRADTGRLRYVRSPDHDHWHLLQFERYELRRVDGTGRVVRDRKTGFCLGDRFAAVPAPSLLVPITPIFRGRCGLHKPGLMEVKQGISVGYGDAYAAHLEFQDLPLDGLADGRYLLIHRVNVHRVLREERYDNNAASVLLDLRWHEGLPHLTVVARCPDAATCSAPSTTSAG